MAVTYDSTNKIITITDTTTLADVKTANDNGSWGVVTQLDNSYLIEASLIIGDGSTDTTLTVNSQNLQLGVSGTTVDWEVKAKASFELYDFRLMDYNGSDYKYVDGNLSMESGIWKSNSTDNVWIRGTYSFLDVTELTSIIVYACAGTLTYTTIKPDVQFYLFTPDMTVDNCSIQSPLYLDDGINATIKNSAFTYSTLLSLWLPNDNSFAQLNVINCTVSSWTVSVGGSDKADYLVQEEYSFKTIIREGTTVVSNAVVYIEDNTNTELLNVLSDNNGAYTPINIIANTYDRAGGTTPNTKQ